MFGNMFKEIAKTNAAEAAKRNEINRKAEIECQLIRQRAVEEIANMEKNHQKNMAAIEEQHQKNMANMEEIRIGIQNAKSSEEQLQLINEMIQMTVRSNEEILAMEASMNNNMF